MSPRNDDPQTERSEFMLRMSCSLQDTCVIAHGDIDLITRIQSDRRWIPGAFCTVENFYFSRYACWYGEYPYLMELDDNIEILAWT